MSPRPRLFVEATALVLLAAFAAARSPAELPPEAALAAAPFKQPRDRADQPDHASLYFLDKRVPVDGPREIGAARYARALAQASRLPLWSSVRERAVPANAKSDPSLEWSAVGPGNVGGRTRVLRFDPSNPDTMYAAGVAGGVWRSLDAGASWHPIGDLMSHLAVASLAIDPADPQRLYAGTGEGHFNFDALRGAGIFVSADGGTHWTPLPGTDGPDFHYVNDLATGATDSRVLYAATRTGLWRSTDRGAQWQRSLDPAVNGGCLQVVVTAEAGADRVLASCGTFAQAVVWRNVDGARGDAWEAVLSEPGMGRTALAVAPSAPGTVYALAASVASGPHQHGLHALFRSDAGGAAGSWTATVRNDDPEPRNRAILAYPDTALCNVGGDFKGQAWYDLALAVDPVDPERVWVGGIDLFRSDDGGRQFGRANYWYLDGHAAVAHADQHGIVFHPRYDGGAEPRLYVVNDGGIYVTVDPNAAVALDTPNLCPNSVNQMRGPSWLPLRDGYAVTQFFHGAVSADGRVVFGGTQDNGTVRLEDAASGSWGRILGGDGGYGAVDPQDADTLYAATTGISIRKSTDGGRTFKRVTAGIDDTGLFINPFVIDPQDGRVLWTSGTQLWRSVDGAASWQAASPRVLDGHSGCSGAKFTALAVDPRDANRVLAGSACGVIVRSGNALAASGAADWQSSRPRAGYVASVAFDPNDRDTVYATYSSFGGRHVYVSHDGGATWRSLDGVGDAALPDAPVHTLVVAPGDSQRLWIGTDIGVFASQDGGLTWAREATGFANVMTEHLVLSASGPTGHELFAFTHGRGVFRAAVTLDRIFDADFEP